MHQSANCNKIVINWPNHVVQPPQPVFKLQSSNFHKPLKMKMPNHGFIWIENFQTASSWFNLKIIPNKTKQFLRTYFKIYWKKNNAHDHRLVITIPFLPPNYAMLCSFLKEAITIVAILLISICFSLYHVNFRDSLVNGQWVNRQIKYNEGK